MSTLLPHQKEPIDSALSIGALKFGSFVLESGCVSPYFFNAGLLSTGPLLDALASGYVTLIAEIVQDTANPLSFDVLFGPAYKGIPAATSLLLHRIHG